jgi:hypothetical protein
MDTFIETIDAKIAELTLLRETFVKFRAEFPHTAASLRRVNGVEKTAAKNSGRTDGRTEQKEGQRRPP